MSTGPAVSVFRENSFYRETWCTRRGAGHIAKYSSDPRQAYHEVKLQGRDLVRVVGIVAPNAGPLPGENSFYRAPGGGGESAQETCVGCP